jgi:transcriptional regulator with XRE-family HTH domain
VFDSVPIFCACQDGEITASGLTKGFISRVERDETSPSVATLLTICEVLLLPIGTLLEASETELVMRADAPLINMGGRGATGRMVTPRGQSKIQFTDRTATLSAGDTITFPGRELHNWKNPGTADAEVTWTLVPAAWSGAV